ncbi:hypothetical protein D0Z00_001814 [Geotrichum galactomycetum]|uniref:Uncharacterized protein n=1 Tax=Geotrichum galactomycetum TaxID=27317 RepID=A0ACB6V633_9ASCO|nr:hypothetical protein D0Z00_001814 [Geotrichum candidum]
MLGPALPSRHEILGGRLSYPAVVGAGALEIEEKVNLADSLVRKALGAAATAAAKQSGSNASTSAKPTPQAALASASGAPASSLSSLLVAKVVLKVRFLAPPEQPPRAKSWFRQGDGARCWESWQVTILFTQAPGTPPAAAATAAAPAAAAATSSSRTSSSRGGSGGNNTNNTNSNDNGSGGGVSTGISTSLSTKILVHDLKAIMLDVIKNASQSYIPAITSPDVSPFPYEISVITGSCSNNESGSGNGGGGSGGALGGNDWGSVIKKILD